MQYRTDKNNSSGTKEAPFSTETLPNDTESFYLGKDGETKWNKNPPPNTKRTSAKNILNIDPGVKGVAKNYNTPIQIWNLYLTDEMINEILNCTNIQLRAMRCKCEINRKQDEKECDTENLNFRRKDKKKLLDYEDLNLEELRAFFGILYMAGVLQSSHSNIRDLWSNDITAPEFFRIVMNRNRFSVIMRALRFDNIETREERRVVDKLAPIRKIIDDFNIQLNKFYTAGDFCTIDEMLQAFRGKCSFRQYILSKPSKYGIKIFNLSDSRTFYTIELEVYVGTQPAGPFSIDNKPSSVVKRLIVPIAYSNRNVTIDNWFSSVKLAEELLYEYKLTIVATIRKNKREIPPSFVNSKKRQLNSSIFGFKKDTVLVSYVPKKNKVVLLISTMHDTGEICPEYGKKMLPEIISFYNSTKGGVDVVDKLSAQYSVARCARRWPVAIFFALLNVAGINSLVLIQLNSGKDIKRSVFLKTLAHELVRPHMLVRASVVTLRTNLKENLKRYLGLDCVLNNNDPSRCAYCPKSKNRFSKSYCVKCSSTICVAHTVKVCSICFEKILEIE